MFWKKESGTKNLPKPTGIPEAVGRYLVVGLKRDPDWVWSLKSVVRPHPEGKYLFDIRVYDEVKVYKSGVKILNYDSLNEHSDLILYEGWFNKSTFQVQVTDPNEKHADPSNQAIPGN